MSILLQSSVENNLLSQLSRADFQMLLPKLQWTEFVLRDNLYYPNQTIEYAYFPTSGIYSVIAHSATGVRGETGIIGREGFLGSAIVLFAESAPFEVLVQVEGRALRIKKDDLQDALAKSPTLMAALLKFIHVFGVQTAQTAVANTHYTVTQRLARWLAMCHDRVDSNEFTMTHEFLSIMLGVRRAGITEAVNSLEGRNIVKATRGKITVLNRQFLIEVASGSYGIPEQEYQRLLQTQKVEALVDG